MRRGAGASAGGAREDPSLLSSEAAALLSKGFTGAALD